MLSNPIRKVSFAVLLASTLISSSWAQSHAQPQTHFSIEDEISPATAVPRDILQTLAKDESVSNCMKDQNAKLSDVQSWFSLAEIPLTESSSSLLVRVINSCLLGANISPFWIFSKKHNSYSEILEGATHDLDVLSLKHHGYHDIKLTSASAVKVYTSTYRFEGTHYRLVKRRAVSISSN
jgi:hypothetical protein